MSNKAPIKLGSEDLADLATTETAHIKMDVRGRSNLAINIKKFVPNGITSLALGIEVSHDGEQWLKLTALNDPNTNWSRNLTSAVNESASPTNAGVGVTIPVVNNTSPHDPIPVAAPFARLVTTATGSPITGSVLEYELVGY